MNNHKSGKLSHIAPIELTDAKREKKLDKIRTTGILTALFITFLGVQDLFLTILNKELPGPVKTAEGILFIGFLVVILWVGFSFQKYKLEPQDEFEIMADHKAKSRAFDFLSTGILFLIIFSYSQNEYILPILFILLGMSWLILTGVIKPKNDEQSSQK